MNAVRVIIATLVVGIALSVLAQQPSRFDPQLLNPGGKLANVYRATPQLYSGSQPESDEDFTALAKLGVKTIVSVDGAAPNVAAAKKHGLRYVHIPIGYGGTPRQAALALTRAAQECAAPVYVHCHHGKHRGPAAAAIMCQAAGAATAQEAHDYLQTAGTATKYKGLYHAVAYFQPPTAEEVLPELKEIGEVPPLAKQMVEIDHLFAVLKNNPAERRSAVEIAELFREVARHEVEHEEDYLALLRLAEVAAAIYANNPKAGADQLPALQRSCDECHENYRD